MLPWLPWLQPFRHADLDARITSSTSFRGAFACRRSLRLHFHRHQLLPRAHRRRRARRLRLQMKKVGSMAGLVISARANW